jgi:hypothetical protein
MKGCGVTHLLYLQDYWVFGLFPSSGILENRKHDILETGSVSILGGGGGFIKQKKLGPT